MWWRLPLSAAQELTPSLSSQSSSPNPNPRSPWSSPVLRSSYQIRRPFARIHAFLDSGASLIAASRLRWLRAVPPPSELELASLQGVSAILHAGGPEPARAAVALGRLLGSPPPPAIGSALPSALPSGPLGRPRGSPPLATISPIMPDQQAGGQVGAVWTRGSSRWRQLRPL